jgi:hypothetical protein
MSERPFGEFAVSWYNSLQNLVTRALFEGNVASFLTELGKPCAP